MNWIYGGSIPELYKEVEILLKDGTTRKDMMIKGKYGTYEWRNYSYFDVLGWRKITENKTNTKENKTMNDFIAMLKKIKPNVDFENEDALVDDGILESLDIITIIAEIADKYDVIIPSDEITSDNFNSAEALYELVEDLK